MAPPFCTFSIENSFDNCDKEKIIQDPDGKMEKREGVKKYSKENWNKFRPPVNL